MSFSKIKDCLNQSYDIHLFATQILAPVFGSRFHFQRNRIANEDLTQTDKKRIQSVTIYGMIELDDQTRITCYEIILHPNVRIEQSRVAIQRYVRQLLLSGDAALINFVMPNQKDTWRLTFLAKDSYFTDEGIQTTTTHPKRYSFLLGKNESCKTAAERFDVLQHARHQNLEALKDTFSVEKLSKVFFNEYKAHYERFYTYLQQFNYQQFVFGGDDKAIRDFSKKLLGRFVFLYFVQKKGWLGATDTKYKDGNPAFIKQLFKESGANEGFYYNWLSVLFFETLNVKRNADNFTMPSGTQVKIPYLNGGLFDKDKYDDAVISFPSSFFYNELNADDPKTRGFLDFLDAFNFTIFEDSPDEHTVAVDPEMLGHIFESLLEDNNEKGAFYTPKDIVHYMCQMALIEYLTSHLSKEFKVYRPLGQEQIELFGNETKQGQLSFLEEMGDKALDWTNIEQIVKHKNIVNVSIQQLQRINQLLDTVKICDPSIGSGAFPMGLLSEIFSIKEIIADTTDALWIPAKVKQNIIQNSIYGVDIERGAVDIARLRFWLSLVVNEELPQPLPNLDYKIVVGNSLVAIFESDIIEIDWTIKHGTQGNLFGNKHDEMRQQLLQEISKTQQHYFHAENKDKKRLSIAIRNLKIELLVNQLELMIKTKGVENVVPNSKKAKEQTDKFLLTLSWKQNIQKLKILKTNQDKLLQHFDWKLDFPEIMNPLFGQQATGFDIVISNPPYRQLQANGGLLAKIYENLDYNTFERTGDIYSLFYERSYQLLRQGGISCTITSNKWMRAAYGESLRHFFVRKTNPLLLLDFGGIQVFENATVDTNIFMFQKADNQFNTKTCVLNKSYLRHKKISVSFEQSVISSAFINADAWVVLSKKEMIIKQKIEKIGIPLKEWDINIYRGILTGFNEAFIIDGKTKDKLIAEDPKSAEIIRPILRGENVKKYTSVFPNNWLITTLPSLKIKIENYPAIQNHLLSFGKKRLEQTGNQGSRKKTSNKWFEIQDAISYWEQLEKPKIIWKRIGSVLRFCLDKEKLYALDSTCFMVGESLEYLLAILNSKIGFYQLLSNSPKTGTGDVITSVQAVEPLRFPKLNEREQQIFIKLVNQILIKKENQESTIYEEQKIDLLLYDLYGFTDAEIKLIEAKI